MKIIRAFAFLTVLGFAMGGCAHTPPSKGSHGKAATRTTNSSVESDFAARKGFI